MRLKIIRQLSTLLLFLAFLFINIGCMTTYLLHSGYNQAKLLKSKVPIKDVLSDPKISQEVKNQLSEVLLVRDFADKKLNLKIGENYLDYVQLDRPYVTWAVTAAKAWELKQHVWWFPIVGSVPYLGFFKEDLAKKEAKKFDELEYDVSVRGITAFSTLGWFNDPILSSMLSRDTYDLVNVVIHESIHATLYIAGDADFNEQIATFLGDWGTELYYLKKDKNNYVLKIIKDENFDRQKFSQFISEKLIDLEKWYKDLDPNLPLSEKRIKKSDKFNQIKADFKNSVLPKMKTKIYLRFLDRELNNAVLLGMRTYFADWDKLESIKQKNINSLIGTTQNLDAAEIQLQAYSKMLTQLSNLKSSSEVKEDLTKLAL